MSSDVTDTAIVNRGQSQRYLLLENREQLQGVFKFEFVYLFVSPVAKECTTVEHPHESAGLWHPGDVFEHMLMGEHCKTIQHKK